MKPLRTSLLTLLMLCTHFCQAQTLFNENGILLQYDGSEKIGSRYDEYCKATFDIYRVKGTVINKNKDKAASINAILNFNGFTCNKIYSENGPVSGEIINKVYTLNIPLQTRHTSPYWVNSFVSLAPDDEMTAYGEVEVKHGEPCPAPERVFNYELIPGAVKQVSSEPADVPEKTTAERIVTEKNTESNGPIKESLIIGDWLVIRVVLIYDNGKKEEFTEELSDFFRFETGGKGIVGGHEFADDLTWAVSGNKLKLNYTSGESYTDEIIKVDETTLILKEYIDKKDENGLKYKFYTYKRGLE